MDHSYLYTKRFLDKQVKALNQPLVLSENLKKIVAEQGELNEVEMDGDDDEEEEGNVDYDEMNEKMLMRIIQRMNTMVKKKNKKLFSGQVTNQVAQQVIKLEHNKLLIINEQLKKVNGLLQPILLPEYRTITGLSQAEKLKQFDDLISQLPTSNYLIINIEDEDDEEEEENGKLDQENGLIQDDSVQIETKKKSQKHFRKNLKKSMNLQQNKQLLDEYDEIRTKLVKLNETFSYDCNKLQYLHNLQKIINDLLPTDTPRQIDSKDFDLYDSDEEIDQGNTSTQFSQPDLQSEVNKFKILMKKLDYKLQDQNLRELIGNLNR